MTRRALCLASDPVLASGAEAALARGQEAGSSTPSAVVTSGAGAGGAGGVAGATLIGGGVRVAAGGAREAAAGLRGEVGEAVTREAVPRPGA